MNSILVDYQPKDLVEVITSSHSGLAPGDIGIVDRDMGLSCSVYFKNTRYVEGGSNASKTRPAIVHLKKEEIKPANDTQTETKNH